LTKTPSSYDISEWIGNNIDFSDYRSPMQAMGKIMSHFKGVDGNVIKKIIME